MSLSANEVKAMNVEIESISSKTKLLAGPALQLMLDLIDLPSGISSTELLRQYVARIKAAEGLVKVFYPIFVI